ncbi:hypothetical protein BH09VER1_BH09VER1_12940 [soil metagenome]
MNLLIPRFVIPSLLLAFALPVTMRAASATWTGGVDGTWITSGNWTPSVPGSATNATTNADTATLLSNVNTTVTVDATRALGSLRLNATAGAFTFNSGAFYFGASGGAGGATAVVLASGATNSQVINSGVNALRIGTGANGFGFTNSSTTATLTFNGSVTGNNGGASAPTTLNLDGVGSSFINGIIGDGTGALSIIKVGSGTWTVTGANTNTGNTTAADGTFAVNFGGISSPSNNVLNSSGTLIFGRTTAGSRVVSITGKSNTVNTQSLSAFTVATGATHLNLAAVGSGSLTVNLGAMSSTGRSAGATLDIKTPAGTTITTTTANISSGVLPQVVTLNGSDFATNNGSNQIVAFSSYTANTASTLGTTSQIVDMTGGNTALTGTGITQIAGLRFNSAAARTITLDPSRMLSVAQLISGGILVTSTVGANLTTISGGLLSGTPTRDLVILQNNTAGDLQIDSILTSSSANSLGLTKSGDGKLILTGQNTMGGVINYLNEGTTVITADATTGNSQTLTTTASTTLTGVNTTGLFIGQRVTGAGLSSQGAYITAVNAGAGTVTLSGATTVGTSSVTFGNSGGLGTFTGSNAVQIGSSATLQIGNGGTTGNLVLNQGILNAGTVAFNRTNAFTFSSTITGTGGVVHAGTGTTTLVSVSDYTGSTVINAGTMLVNGSASNSAATVNSGGALGGTGSVGSVTLNAGGALAPGSGGLGNFATNNGDLVWNGQASGAFGQMKFELGTGNASDLIALGTGMLDKNTGSIFSFDFQGTGTVGNTYTLITFGSTDFLVSDFSYTGLASGLTGSFVENAGNLQFVTSAVPEPSVVALAGLGLALVVWRGRRRTITRR